VNEACFHLVNSDLPFGGVGNSGMGAYHGQYGFDNCSHLKPVFDKAGLNVWPFSARFPPYT
jgi:acyl-CoA reductase-like NAD-dependent aldehyde dehydrogenase